MALNSGTIINNLYRIVKLLGSGSMGNVYLVERLCDRKRLVIKEVLLKSVAGHNEETARELFRREAEFMKKFNRQGLPKMYEFFNYDGVDYLVMDYMEGKTLEEIITSSWSKTAVDKALKWITGIAGILDYLHNSFQSPIVYRDLKPSNIIIGSDNKPALVDFGIARYYNPDKNTDTFCYGSPGYAAPEQYRGRGQTTPQTDVFALGVILYQMLTGYDPTVKPFTFPPIKKLNPSIPEELVSIVTKAIELDPLKRYISMIDFKEALEKYINSSKKPDGEEKISSEKEKLQSEKF